MTPRPRRRGNKDLPENLYSNKKNGRTYYRYKHPATGEFTGFGTNKVDAVKAARQLNQLLMRDQSTLKDRVVKSAYPFSEYLDLYSETILPERRVKGFPLSEKTLSENRRIIKRVDEELGHIGIYQLIQKDIADYLNGQSTAEVHNKHRSILISIFKHMISDGWEVKNLPQLILEKDTGKVKRRRLTLDEYDKIYDKASPAIRNAMELSLNALQRREDIRTWRFDHERSDGKENQAYCYIVQSKTRKHGVSAYLRIPASLPVVHSAAASRTLADILKKCRDQYVCPFVVHQPPQRRRMSKEKEHSMQLSGKQISDGFAEAREAAGIIEEYPPTFHELLSLGEHLRKQQGWTVRQIQVLKGHTSEKMTRHYLDGHEWTTVEIGNG